MSKFLVVNQNDINRGEEEPSDSFEVIKFLSGQPRPERYRIYLGDSADIWIKGDRALEMGRAGLILWATMPRPSRENLEYRVEELEQRLEELEPNLCPVCAGDGGRPEYVGEGVSEYTECHFCDDKLKMSNAEVKLKELEIRHYNTVLDHRIAMDRLKVTHRGYCGHCLKEVEKGGVSIRTMGAPNPFCNMDCANEWGKYDKD